MSVLDYVPRRVCDELVEVLVRLDELGESVERRSLAGLVVCCRITRVALTYCHRGDCAIDGSKLAEVRARLTVACLGVAIAGSLRRHVRPRMGNGRTIPAALHLRNHVRTG